jgi:hypothetical protein
MEEGQGIYKLRFFLPSDSEADGERIFDWAVAENLKILGMNRRTLSLEDIFVSITSDETTSNETQVSSKTDESAQESASIVSNEIPNETGENQEAANENP